MSALHSQDSSRNAPHAGPSTVRPSSDAQLDRVLGLHFREHLGLAPLTFPEELTSLANAVRDSGAHRAGSVEDVVHRARFERCKRSWNAGEVDVDVDVTAEDLVAAAEEIRGEKRSQYVEAVEVPRSQRRARSAVLSQRNQPSPLAPPSAITDASQIVFEPESPAYIIEQDLAKRFGRANFRHYFCISPADILHGPLKKLSNFMLDLGKTLAELRRMALEARDARIEKSQNSKRRPAYPIKDTVTGGDVNFVTDVLQREATKQYRETHWPKRKRSAENEPDDSVRVIVDDSLGMIKKKRLLSQLQKTQGISRVAERPLFGLVPSDTAAAWNTQAHMGPTPRRIIARRANAAAASIPQSGSGATPAVAASPVPALSAPAPAIPAAAVPSFPAEAIALSAMDNSMIDSFFNIATTQAKGLTKGQEMNLKIGRKEDGSYYFTHQLQKGS